MERLPGRLRRSRAENADQCGVDTSLVSTAEREESKETERRLLCVGPARGALHCGEGYLEVR